MTLQAPEHLRGDMRDRPAHIREERRQWVASATSRGISRVRIQKALGIFQAPPQTRPKRDRKGFSEAGALPPVADRLPDTPRLIDMIISYARARKPS